jgi:hypothetical protein
MTEYDDVIAWRQTSRIYYKRKEAEEHESAVRRRMERRRRGEERMLLRKIVSAERQALLARLSGMSSIARLEAVAFDQVHAIQFYPDSFAALDEAQIGSMPHELRSALLLLLESIRRGPWRTLRSRLLGVGKPH